MSEVFGTSENMVVSDTVDSDCDLEIQIWSDSHAWLTEDDAKRLIKHLQHVFEL